MLLAGRSVGRWHIECFLVTDAVDYSDLENPTLIAARDELVNSAETIRSLYPTLAPQHLKVLVEPCEKEICGRYGVDQVLLDRWILNRILRDIKLMASKIVFAKKPPMPVPADAEWEGIPLKLYDEGDKTLVLTVHKNRTK